MFSITSTCSSLLINCFYVCSNRGTKRKRSAIRRNFILYFRLIFLCRIYIISISMLSPFLYCLSLCLTPSFPCYISVYLTLCIFLSFYIYPSLHQPLSLLLLLVPSVRVHCTRVHDRTYVHGPPLDASTLPKIVSPLRRTRLMHLRLSLRSSRSQQEENDFSRS